MNSSVSLPLKPEIVSLQFKQQNIESIETKVGKTEELSTDYNRQEWQRLNGSLISTRRLI